MAQRSRLSVPVPEPRKDWPWHDLQWNALPLSLLRTADRRFEAENYLLGGYGLRLKLQGRTSGWKPLSELAHVWQPSRLKGIQVNPAFGTPFLTATQIFDICPAPRKWLSLERTGDASNRFIDPGTIVVTCSGAVGRVTLANASHENILISHDLLRVEVRDRSQWGWVYAYLRSPQARAMMTSSRYGHIIKHLETSHLNELPVPVLNEKNTNQFNSEVATILDLRDRSYKCLREAEDRYAGALGVPEPITECTFSVRSSEIFSGRRRFEGNYHAPVVNSIIQRFKENGTRINSLAEVTEKVWWENRFRRFYAEGGIPYLSADELFTINPIESKRIVVSPNDNHADYFVNAGWIIMACSGQIYGLNGSALLATQYHEGIFFSHDLIRIIPKTETIRPGYLLVTLTHRDLGRPVLMRSAYGTSIPHLDPNDVAAFPVVRLSKIKEDQIADLCDEAALCRSQADDLERSLSLRSGKLIEDFLTGDTKDFTVSPFSIVR